MVFFINSSDIIGQIMSQGTTSIMGSAIAALFFVLIVLFLICMMFGIPFEFTAIFILPFCLAVGAYYSAFYIPIVAIFLYIGYIVSKNWLFK